MCISLYIYTHIHLSFSLSLYIYIYICKSHKHNSTTVAGGLLAGSFVLCVFRRVKDRQHLLHHSPLLKKRLHHMLLLKKRLQHMLCLNQRLQYMLLLNKLHHMPHAWLAFSVSTAPRGQRGAGGRPWVIEWRIEQTQIGCIKCKH